MQWYNGFSPEERIAKSDALKAALRKGTVPLPRGNCALCGEASDDLEYHSEDYAKEYRWTPPAMYVLCRHCHRQKIHIRFRRPTGKRSRRMSGVEDTQASGTTQPFSARSLPS